MASTIATYSVTGAAFGYGLLWTALFSFPMMAAVQLMCSRLAMVTGRGLAAVVRQRYSRWVLWGACFLLAVANVTNIGADLGGMADAMRMMTGISALWWTPAFAGFLAPMIMKDLLGTRDDVRVCVDLVRLADHPHQIPECPENSWVELCRLLQTRKLLEFRNHKSRKTVASARRLHPNYTVARWRLSLLDLGSPL